MRQCSATICFTDCLRAAITLSHSSTAHSPSFSRTVVGAGAGAFLAAQGGEAGVEQGAEELPAGRRLVAADPELGRHPVGGGGRRHGAGDAGDAAPVAWCKVGVGGEQGERVRGRHELPAPDDEVAVAVAVRRRAEVGRVGAHHQVVEVLGMDEVGVGMAAAEVGGGHGIDHAASRGAEVVDQDRSRVGAGDGVHRIEAQAQPAGDGRADEVEVEQRAHQRVVVGDGIDHLDGHRAQFPRAEVVEVDVGRVQRPEAGDRLGAGVDGVGDRLGRRAAVVDVVLDAEVAVRPAGIVRGRQDQAAEGAARPDHAGRRRRRQQA